MIQTGSVILFLSIMPICIGWLFWCLMLPTLWPLVLAYLAWAWYDWGTPEEGGRGPGAISWFRRITAPWFRSLAAYFPTRLHVPASFPFSGDPEIRSAGQRYIFSFHPHGFVTLSLFASLLSDGCGISRHLTGAHEPWPLRAVTLSTNFLIPFWRDWVLLLGLASVSAHSIGRILASGRSVLIVPGGARESLDCGSEGVTRVVLKTRRGFIRVAMRSGVDGLIPVYAFGEDSLYRQLPNPQGSALRRVQDWVLARTGVAMPIILNSIFAFLPDRKPLDVVVGDPISVPHDPHPSEELVSRVHEQYKVALLKLFDDNKTRFGFPHHRLEFV